MRVNEEQGDGAEEGAQRGEEREEEEEEEKRKKEDEEEETTGGMNQGSAQAGGSSYFAFMATTCCSRASLVGAARSIPGGAGRNAPVAQRAPSPNFQGEARDIKTRYLGYITVRLHLKCCALIPCRIDPSSFVSPQV